MNDTSTRRTALIVASLSSFITPFVGSSINIALPAIQQDLGIDAVILSWVATSYLLASAVSLVPFGRLADIYGRKRIFTGGIIIFTVASCLAALADSASMLIATRIFQGVGSAMIFATGIAILTSVYPPEERGRVLGINVGVVYIGLSLGPFLGGLLTQYLSWRSIFLFNVPLGLIIIILVLRKLKGEWAEAGGESFDLRGAIMYSLALVAVMYGITRLPGAMSYGCILVGMLGLVAFARWEGRVGHPLLELELFRRNRVFIFSSLAAFIHYSATFATTFFLSLYLQYVRGFNPQTAGLILVSQPIVMALCSPLAGKLSDRIEPRLIASVGMTVTACCLAMFATLSAQSNLIYVVCILIISGLGYALFSSPNTNAIMGSVERRFYGLASGSVGTMRLLGMVVSMSIATVIFSVYMGRVRITVEYYDLFLKGMRVAFVICAVLCVGGIFASLARGNVQGMKGSN